MSQPGRPNKPDALWWTMEQILALHGPGALGTRDDLRRELKLRVQAMMLDVYQEGEPLGPDRVYELLRDHLYGWPPPGA